MDKITNDRNNAIKLINEINKALRIKPISNLELVILESKKYQSSYLRINIRKINTLKRILKYIIDHHYIFYNISLNINDHKIKHSWIDIISSDCYITYYT